MFKYKHQIDKKWLKYMKLIDSKWLNIGPTSEGPFLGY